MCPPCFQMRVCPLFQAQGVASRSLESGALSREGSSSGNSSGVAVCPSHQLAGSLSRLPAALSFLREGTWDTEGTTSEHTSLEPQA